MKATKVTVTAGRTFNHPYEVRTEQRQRMRRVIPVSVKIFFPVLMLNCDVFKWLAKRSEPLSAYDPYFVPVRVSVELREEGHGYVAEGMMITFTEEAL